MKNDPSGSAFQYFSTKVIKNNIKRNKLVVNLFMSDEHPGVFSLLRIKNFFNGRIRTRAENHPVPPP